MGGEKVSCYDFFLIEGPIKKLNQSGVDTRATVDSMQEVGSQLGGGHQIDFELVWGAAS